MVWRSQKQYKCGHLSVFLDMEASRFLSYIYTYCNIREVMLLYLQNGTNSAKESDIQTKRIRTSAERLGIGKEAERQGVGMVVLQTTVP